MSKAPNIAPVSELRISEITEISGQDEKATTRMVKRGAEIMEAVNDASDDPPRRSGSRSIH